MGAHRTILLLSLILCFAVVSIPEIGVVKAEDAIYIRVDGSVEGTDKIQRAGYVYTLKDNLVSEFGSDYGLTIEADNIILDGAGFTLQGSGNHIGINLPTLTPDGPGRSNVTIKNGNMLFEGVTIEDDVFIGPHVFFTNDLHPRSPRMPAVRERYSAKENWLATTVLEQGCSVGANATIVAGVTLGRYSMVGAASVVTRDVEPFALVAGNPARRSAAATRR